jgi:riboflavin synthase
MFTGLVELMAPVVEVKSLPPGRRLVVSAPTFSSDLAIGDSIAVNGCCLTAIDSAKGNIAFDAGPETLERTNLGQLAAGSRVNLERSLRVGDRMGGHFVTGHIDGVGFLERREDLGDWSNFWFSTPEGLSRQMASKGSIAVDGVSLTLVEVEPLRFSVQLIPHTLTMTTLGALKAGDRVNLETDLLAKYAQRLVDAGTTP